MEKGTTATIWLLCLCSAVLAVQEFDTNENNANINSNNKDNTDNNAYTDTTDYNAYTDTTYFTDYNAYDNAFTDTANNSLPTTVTSPTTETTTTEPATTTPPPNAVRIVTTDRSASQSFLAGVDVRVLVPGGNITRIWEERRTGGTGSTLIGLPEEEPVIITFKKPGYLISSITYKFERVGKNIITMPMSRAPEYREFDWISGIGAEFRLGNNRVNPFKLVIEPGTLDVAEGTKMALEFKEVDVTIPQELREAPELIGAYRETGSDDDYQFEGLETFAMVALSLEPYFSSSSMRFIVGLEMEIPLSNLPSDVKPGDKLEVWTYDPYRGVWLYEKKGTVERGRSNQMILIFTTKHLSWFAVVRRIAVTNCVTVTTCYDKKGRYRAPNVPVRLRGVDFLYTSTRTTNEVGMTCFHYKHHGEVEISSQCSSKVRISRGKGKSSVCPAHFNTQLITSEASNVHSKCATVKLLVSENISECEKPNDPRYGFTIGNDYDIGAEIAYSCLPHYDLYGPTHRICLECGVWSKMEPKCVSHQ